MNPIVVIALVISAWTIAALCVVGAWNAAQWASRRHVRNPLASRMTHDEQERFWTAVRQIRGH